MAEETAEDIRFESRMNDADALMWRIEKDPMLRSTITSVIFIDGRIRPDELRTAFDRFSRAVPRLRQRVRGNPYSLAPPRWEVDPNFDLDYHLRVVRAPGRGTVRDVLDLAQPVAMQGFDRARPVWEATLVTGGANGSTALILKIHHSVTDGVGAVELMLELFDLEREAPPRPQPDAPEVHVLNQAQRFVDALAQQSRQQGGFAAQIARGAANAARGALADPAGTMESATQMAESIGRLLAPASAPLGPLLQGRSLSVHFDRLTLPLAPMKAAGHAVGGKLNDAFVAGILLAVKKYHRKLGSDTDALRMGMPINVRVGEGTRSAGNAFVPARFEVPVDVDDAATLMARTHGRLVDVVREPALGLVDPLSNVLNRFPATVTTQIFGGLMRGLDFQASNVPGSPIPLYLLGREVTGVVPFGPMAGSGTNITLLSYCEDVSIGVNLDPAAFTDAELFMDCLRAAYDEVIAVGDR